MSLPTSPHLSLPTLPVYTLPLSSTSEKANNGVVIICSHALLVSFPVYPLIR